MTSEAETVTQEELEEERELQEKIQETKRLKELVKRHLVVKEWLSDSETEEFTASITKQIDAAKKYGGFSEKDIISSLFGEMWRLRPKGCGCETCKEGAERLLLCTCYLCTLLKRTFESNEDEV